MEPRFGTTLSGSWRPGIAVHQHDALATGRCAEATAPHGTQLTLSQDRPGLHPLYYGVAKDYIHWDESEWRLLRRLRGLGATKPKATLVEGGDRITFRGKYADYQRDPYPVIPNHDPGSMQAAQRGLASRLLYAVEQIYTEHQCGPVALALSGGVDSIAIAWALKHIGADVLCLTVGRTEDDFDPQWAQRAAAYLGLPWEFVALPEATPALQQLLERTLTVIEQTSFSNVLMGLCVELLRDRMQARGTPVIYTGFWGDLLFGHKLQVVGHFNHLPLPEQTDASWTRARVKHCWHSKPHTLQLAKGFRHGGQTTWRAPFLHPEVSRYAFGLPRAYAPVEMDKPLLYGLMDQYVPSSVAAWHVMRKIGFYTGAGAGKIRLANPVLQDPNIRATFQRLKARHT